MASKWGSFLSSVESRLDNILLDDDSKSQQKVATPLAKPADSVSAASGAAQITATPRASSPARTVSTNRAQERLNERFARVMASKGLARKDSATPTSLPSRTGSPVSAVDSPRSSLDNASTSKEGTTNTSATEATSTGTTDLDTIHLEHHQEIKSDTMPLQQKDDDIKGEHGSLLAPDVELTHSLRPSVELSRTTSPAPPSLLLNSTNGSTADLAHEKALAELRAENETSELKRQEDVREYMERIDALQAKLQYLTKEALEASQKASAEARSGSLEQKLAAKDEKIALLLEEGQRLSQTELKHMNLIKKFRHKSLEDEKVTSDAKRQSEKHERLYRDAQQRLQRATSSEKKALELAKALPRLEKDLENLQIEKSMQQSQIQDLQTKLSAAIAAAQLAEEKVQADAIEIERQRASELSEKLNKVLAEKEETEKVAQTALREATEKFDRESERNRVALLEKQGELSMLESKLEAYRARVEEASAGQGIDVQAKLLRQIETLQNQYVVATENWQGIEGSILTRTTALEKERDDLLSKEAVMRKKSREATARCKKFEDEVDRLSSRTEDLESERESLLAQVTALQDRLQRAEANVEVSRKELKNEREAFEARQAQRMEEERARAKEEAFRSPSIVESMYSPFRADSSLNLSRTRKSSISGDPVSSSMRRATNLKTLTISGPGGWSSDRSLTRRSSTHPVSASLYQPSDMSGPLSRAAFERQDSTSTVPAVSVNDGTPQTPTNDYDVSSEGEAFKRQMTDEDFFAGVQTPATPPERSSAMPDALSVSTAAAGPSVQLVERMSATVRRLESEKATHKDDLLRLSQQRDEARDQVVELMRDGQDRTSVVEKLKVAEQDLADLQARYNTTLELLGEKSERVEELTADVADLKVMMREIVEEKVR